MGSVVATVVGPTVCDRCESSHRAAVNWGTLRYRRVIERVNPLLRLEAGRRYVDSAWHALDIQRKVESMQTALERPSLVPTGRRVPPWWWFAAVLALGIAAYSLRIAFLGEQAYTPELAPSFRERPLTVAIHALFGPVALLGGLINLLPGTRRGRMWPAHRWVGRAYVVSTLLLAGAGLSMAFHAAGGVGPQAAFALLALGTLATTVQAYRHIRAHRVRQHREWMLRSYGLIFAAVMLRLWMPALVMLVYDGQFIPAYRWAAWLAWVPNVLVVEWILRRGWRPAFILRDGFAAAEPAQS